MSKSEAFVSLQDKSLCVELKLSFEHKITISFCCLIPEILESFKASL